MGLTIRHATVEDVPLILAFIKGIAEYEKLLHEVEATEAMLAENLFGNKPAAHVIIAFEDYTPVGFALYFYNFSTFRSKKGLYLEDLFVWPEYRGKGYGKALFSQLLERASQSGCGRMEWSVLDWNQPAIDFYHSFGAKPMSGWTTFRIII